MQQEFLCLHSLGHDKESGNQCHFGYPLSSSLVHLSSLTRYHFPSLFCSVTKHPAISLLVLSTSRICMCPPYRHVFDISVLFLTISKDADHAPLIIIKFPVPQTLKLSVSTGLFIVYRVCQKKSCIFTKKYIVISSDWSNGKVENDSSL